MGKVLAAVLMLGVCSPVFAADCLDLSGEYKLQSSTERSSDDDEIGRDPGEEEFTYGNRNFKLEQTGCDRIELTPFWSFFGSRKYGETRVLERDTNGVFFTSWRALHFELTITITPTINANIVGLRYTRKRWVFDGAFAPLKWYEASFIAP